jgi:hypothetical protein
MQLQHLDHYTVARIVTACALLLLGVAQIAAPRCFWGLSIYFRNVTRLAMPSDAARLEQERLKRVLAARERAEGDSDSLTRYAGIFTIAMAGLVLVQSLPYVLAYAFSCLAMAAAIMISYLRFRRATERRVAPLVRRSPWKSLPPVAVLACGVGLLGTASFGVYPEFRLDISIVIVSAVALLGVAWRVATAPALLFGEDSQLEYVVDEHLRYCRAISLVSLATAPLVVFVALAWATLPPSAPHVFDAVTLTVVVAFVIILVMSLNPIRKRISLA